MLQALSAPHDRIVSSLFLAASCACAIAALAVGIDDNPPGILLAYLAAFGCVLTFVHPWRTAREYRRLFYGSFLGFVLFAVAHNVFEALGSRLAAPGMLHGLLQALSVVAFFVAVLLCPPAFLIGAVGWPAMTIRQRRRYTPHP